MARLTDWPLIRQLRSGADGTGLEAASARTRRLLPRIGDAEVARSVCPYCGVGCGQLVHHRDGELLAIEGDPESPISQGTLCPKGSASHQLLTHSRRLGRVLYRRPRGTRWEEIGLEEAMRRVADRVWESRKRGFVRTVAELPDDDPTRLAAEAAPGDRATGEVDVGTDGERDGGGSHGGDAPGPDAGDDPLAEPVNHTATVAHLGGATLDNEENYLIKKLFTGGLGMVAVSNQARI